MRQIGISPVEDRATLLAEEDIRVVKVAVMQRLGDAGAGQLLAQIDQRWRSDRAGYARLQAESPSGRPIRSLSGLSSSCAISSGKRSIRRSGTPRASNARRHAGQRDLQLGIARQQALPMAQVAVGADHLAQPRTAIDQDHPAARRIGRQHA